MVATQQDRRHRLTIQYLWPSVMGVIQQAVTEGIFLGGTFVPERVGQGPYDGVDHEHGGNLAAAKDEVAYRPFLLNVASQKTLVYSFVAARHED